MIIPFSLVQVLRQLVVLRVQDFEVIVQSFHSPRTCKLGWAMLHWRHGIWAHGIFKMHFEAAIFFHEVVNYIVLTLVASSLWNPGYSFSASRRSAIESSTSWTAQTPYVWRKGLVTSMPSKIKNPRAMFFMVQQTPRPLKFESLKNIISPPARWGLLDFIRAILLLLLG